MAGNEAPERGNGSDEPTHGPWRELHLWQIQPVRDVLGGLMIVGIFWLGLKLSLITVPLLLAILLAYLLEPVVSLITMRANVGRTTAAGGLIVLTGLVIVVPAVVALALGLTQA